MAMKFDQETLYPTFPFPIIKLEVHANIRLTKYIYENKKIPCQIMLIFNAAHDYTNEKSIKITHNNLLL